MSCFDNICERQRTICLSYIGTFSSFCNTNLCNSQGMKEILRCLLGKIKEKQQNYILRSLNMKDNMSSKLL